MDDGPEMWGMNPWGPSAPESCVLLDGPKGLGEEAFRLAVLELIARHRLTVAEESEPRNGTSTARLLLPGPEKRPTGHRPLDAIHDLFEEIRSSRVEESGLRMKELAKATRKRYGSLDGYAKTEVLPALERRGLYERRERKLLWLIPVTRWELTRTGEASRAQLRQNRSVGEEHFGEWVRRDPERAYQFLGLAGSSLLLMEALHPELEDLEDEHEAVYPPFSPGPSSELPNLAGALSTQGSWSDSDGGGGGNSGGGWFDGGGSGGGGWFDGGGGGGFDGGGGGGGGF